MGSISNPPAGAGEVGPPDCRNPVRLILLRHGESEINAACNEIGPPGHPGRDLKYYDPAFVDPKLSPLGRTQALNAGDAVRAALVVDLDSSPNSFPGDVVVLVSTLTRALETALIALAPLREFLGERSNGSAGGSSQNWFNSRFPWFAVDACRETSLEFNVHGAGLDSPGRVLDQGKACNQRGTLTSTKEELARLAKGEKMKIDFERFCDEGDTQDPMESIDALDARIDRFVQIVREVAGDRQARGGATGGAGGSSGGPLGGPRGPPGGDSGEAGMPGKKETTVIVVGHYVFFYRFLRRYFPDQEAGLRNAECRVLTLS